MDKEKIKQKAKQLGGAFVEGAIPGLKWGVFCAGVTLAVAALARR